MGCCKLTNEIKNSSLLAKLTIKNQEFAYRISLKYDI